MKTLIATLATAALLAGCQSASTGSSAPKTTTKSFKYSNGDGSTMMTAVEIRTRSSNEGGVLIRDWIKANYPGYAIDRQELMRDEHMHKMYNMITIIDPNNNTRRLFFDVTEFHRRYEDELPNEIPRTRQ